VYEEFYHLSAKPFRLSPDPGFFFPSRGHKRALAYLRYGLSQDEGFVVITGAPGTGKTTLAQILLREMDQTKLVVAHLTTSQLDSDELLRMISAALGLRFDGVNKAGLLKTLEAFLLARSREQKRVLLVIDEAQNLPAKSLEELRMLSNLQVGDKALVQTFLLGQAQFRQKLDHPDLEQFSQRVIANYHLSELAEDECKDYIETRLTHVGWVNDPVFTSDAYRGVYEYTKGVPRRINMLCDRLMLFGCLEERHEIDNKVLKEVTEELQQEISGQPILMSNLTENEEPGKTSEPKPDGESANSPETIHPKGKNVVKELASQDSHSTYAKDDQLNSSASEEQNDTENRLMDKAVPDEGYEDLLVQAQSDDAGHRDKNNDNSNHKRGSYASNDRLQVISGGRKENTGHSEYTFDKMVPANNLTPDTRPPFPHVSDDSEEVILRKILRLVLAYHRSPRSFPGLDDPSQPLPRGIKEILALAVSDDETLRNFRQISVMGISPAMLRAAVRFFVRRVLFVPGGDEYRVLGLLNDATRQQIEDHYGLLMRLLRQEKKSTEESGVMRVGEAYERLCEDEITYVVTEDVPQEEEVKDIEDRDELDLDLAPVIMDPDSGQKYTRSTPGRTREFSAAEPEISHGGRNILLIAGAAVVIFVLYLTQVGSRTPENAAGTPVDTAAGIQQKANVDETAQNSLPESASISEKNIETGSQSDSNVSLAEPSSDEADAEIRRQQVLAELRTNAELMDAQRETEAEQAKRAEIEKEKARLTEELRKVKEAQQQAEAKARQEAEARAKAEAQAKAAAAAAAKAAADAKAAAVLALKEKQMQAQVSVTESTTTSNAAKATTATSNASTVSSGSLTAKELNAHMANYEAAFAAGDMTKLPALFTATVRTNKNTDLTGLREEYRKLFDNTLSRNVHLKNINWSIDYNNARGSGDYEQVIATKNSATKTQTKGEVTLQVERKDGQIKIMRLYYGDPVSSKQLPLDTTAHAPEIELNRVLANFTRAYEGGDIEHFMALFSANAKTNDRSSLEGIRQDYVDLFSTTSKRSMLLNNMKWSWIEGIASAEGTFEVKVQPKGQENTNTYRGKIWFSVLPMDGRLKISYFAFVVEG